MPPKAKKGNANNINTTRRLMCELAEEKEKTKAMETKYRAALNRSKLLMQQKEAIEERIATISMPSDEEFDRVQDKLREMRDKVSEARVAFNSARAEEERRLKEINDSLYSEYLAKVSLKENYEKRYGVLEQSILEVKEKAKAVLLQLSSVTRDVEIASKSIEIKEAKAGLVETECQIAQIEVEKLRKTREHLSTCIERAKNKKSNRVGPAVSSQLAEFHSILETQKSFLGKLDEELKTSSKMVETVSKTIERLDRETAEKNKTVATIKQRHKDQMEQISEELKQLREEIEQMKATLISIRKQ